MAKSSTITLAGLRFIPDLSGALYAPELKALLVADLHLEQGASLARRGIAVPPYDTALTLSTLDALLNATDVQTLYFLGDSFHDAAAVKNLSLEVMQRLRAITTRFSTMWIAGNHDPRPKNAVGGSSVAEAQLGPITLRHEPQKLSSGAFEISGHLHPGAAIAQRGSMVRGKCFVSDPQRIVLPAFGAYTGGMNIHSKPFHGLFEHKATQVHILARQGLHAFPFARTC